MWIILKWISVGNRPDYCSLPPVLQGEKKCKGYIKKWTFNETEEACVSYIYGGCNGTKNLFDTEEECKAICPALAAVLSQKKFMEGTTAQNSSSSIHPHQYLLAVINCLYSFFFLLTRYFNWPTVSLVDWLNTFYNLIFVLEFIFQYW